MWTPFLVILLTLIPLRHDIITYLRSWFGDSMRRSCPFFFFFSYVAIQQEQLPLPWHLLKWKKVESCYTFFFLFDALSSWEIQCTPWPKHQLKEATDPSTWLPSRRSESFDILEYIRGWDELPEVVHSNGRAIKTTPKVMFHDERMVEQRGDGTSILESS